jgi:antitoxin component HigA of HigAB toxin-antitoxin module
MDDNLTEEQYNLLLKEVDTLMKKGEGNLTLTELTHLQYLSEQIETYEDMKIFKFLQKDEELNDELDG